MNVVRAAAHPVLLNGIGVVSAARSSTVSIFESPFPELRPISWAARPGRVRMPFVVGSWEQDGLNSSGAGSTAVSIGPLSMPCHGRPGLRQSSAAESMFLV